MRLKPSRERMGAVRVEFEEAPEFLEYDKGTDKIYLNIKSTDHLQVIDPETRKVVSTWSTAPMKSPHGSTAIFLCGQGENASDKGRLPSAVNSHQALRCE